MRWRSSCSLRLLVLSRTQCLWIAFCIKEAFFLTVPAFRLLGFLLEAALCAAARAAFRAAAAAARAALARQSGPGPGGDSDGRLQARFERVAASMQAAILGTAKVPLRLFPRTG